MMITVVLNAYKRQKELKAQIECVNQQTIPPTEILVWNNGDHIEPASLPQNVVICNSSKNFGVWSRFSFALNADSEFVCILDDDTFPGERFFENCLQQMKVEEALFGTRGLRFMSSKRYNPFLSFGWDCPNEKTEVVDIVGHAWFFKRQWLSAFWAEQPPFGASRIVGEDIHFSFMLQKYLGIRTLVPPHPENQTDLWGSCPNLALKLGTSSDAISQDPSNFIGFDKALRNYTSNGFNLCKDVYPELFDGGAVVFGRGLARSKIIRSILSLHPSFEKYARKVQIFLIKHNIHI